MTISKQGFQLLINTATAALRCAEAAGIEPAPGDLPTRVAVACDAVLALVVPPPGYDAGTLAAAQQSARQSKVLLATV